MEFKVGALRGVAQMLLLCLIFSQHVDFTVGRSTAQSEDVGGDFEVKADEEVRKIDFQVHILTKREADPPEDGETPPGRTFPASEPLDPNGPLAHTQEDVFEGFEGFETVNEIFQPTVDGDTEEETGDVDELTEQKVEDQDAETDDEQSEEAEDSLQPQDADYGAQYPYTETTRTSGQYQGAGYGTNPGTEDQTYVSRRVVLTGRSGQPIRHTEYVETEHRSSGGTPYASNQRQPSGSYSTYSTYNRQHQPGSRYPSGATGSQYTSSGTARQYPSGATGSQYASGGTGSQYYSGGTVSQYPSRGTGTQYSGYQTSGSSTRGAYYNGPRYIDNNGHYIDANGRHLDSTGRYYDTSGRYQDAVVTRTVTYQSVPSTAQRYTDSTGQTFSYVDQTGSRGVQNVGSLPTGNTYSSGGYGGSGYTDQYGGTQVGGTPVTSYGTQFYSGGQGYPATYDPVVSRISNDPNCPTQENVQVTINGLSCTNAVSQLGAFVCYNYERVSRECCERCLQVKQPDVQGCEYGDRSQQCRNINPYDCYNERNSQICCQRCREFREQRPQAGSSCMYGDMTPRCQPLIQRSHLCYLPENQRLCCATCPRLANQDEPDCRWGNQNPELCSEPFDAGRRLRLNCYLTAVQEVCCSTCRSLRERIRENIPGCEYGDHPVQISTSRGVLDCGEYIRYYGVENCDGGELAQKCCYTCYRYRHRQG